MAESSAKPLWRWIAVGLASAAAVWLVSTASTHERAFHDGASDSPELWQKAARIEPSNADNWYRLGRYHHLDLEHEDLPLAISDYRRALQLDPLSPYYKLDLAGALELENQNTEADQYYRAAQEEYPISAEVSWRYGNFLLRQQRLPEAYAQLYRAITVDPKLVGSVISLAWRANPDVDSMIGQLLHNEPELDWQALAFFIQGNNGAAALKTWKDLAAQKSPPDWNEVNSLIDLLIQQAFYDDAGGVWSQAQAISGNPSQRADASLVFNGGFEHNLSGGGFGWRLQNVSGASFDFDSAEKHSGMRSARIKFDGTQNLDYQNLYQNILVRPGTSYHFSGYLRTDQISTNSGVRFELHDVQNPSAPYALTSNETGTISWTNEQADLTTGPQTRIIRISLRRMPSDHFDNKIYGTVWIDDVDLVPIERGK